MSAKEYECIWHETNAEAKSVPPYKRDIVWNRIFVRKMKEASRKG